MVRRPASLEGHAAAASDRGKAHRISVTNLGMHILERDPQRLGKLLGNRCPCAADVRRALGQMHRAVTVHHR